MVLCTQVLSWSVEKIMLMTVHLYLYLVELTLDFWKP